MTGHCVLLTDRQVIRCDHCGIEIPLPLPLSVNSVAIIGTCFMQLHQSCAPGGNTTCPAGDPACDQPHPDAPNGPHCHDACEALPRTLVGTMARWFEDGEFVMAVAEIARKEAP